MKTMTYLSENDHPLGLLIDRAVSEFRIDRTSRIKLSTVRDWEDTNYEHRVLFQFEGGLEEGDYYSDSVGDVLIEYIDKRKAVVLVKYTV